LCPRRYRRHFAEKNFPPEKQEFDVLPWISTSGSGTGASFYISRRNPIPWAVDYVAPEAFSIARFR
jgi:hypothetical protein